MQRRCNNMKYSNAYDIETKSNALEEAIDYINKAMSELEGLDYQDQIDELVSIRNTLEQLQEENNDLLCEIQEAEEQELDNEYEKSKL